MYEKCAECDKQLKWEEQGLCKKLLHSHPVKFLCLSCLANYLDTTEEVLQKQIEYYRQTGCPLF